MAETATNAKQQAHELVDRLNPNQAMALVTLIHAMLEPAGTVAATDDPVARAGECHL